MSIRRTWLAVLPVAALVVAGCGGGGDDSTETTATTTSAAPAALSKAELIEQGDAICGEVNAAVGSAGSGEEGSSATTQVADLYSGMVASLNNLGTPEEKEGYPEFSEAAEELATAEGEVKLAAEREDTAALETAESNASSALASFQNAASEYGFKDCSEGPSAPTPGSSSGSVPGEVESGGAEPEAVAPETVEPEIEPEPVPEEVAPETGGAGGAPEGGGSGAPEGGGGSTGGSSGGIGPG